MKPFLLNFPQRGDERGWLVVVESNKDVPFDINVSFIFTELNPISFAGSMQTGTVNLYL